MDDLISRQAAIDALIKLGDHWNGHDEVKRGIHHSVGVIEDMPPVQPEQDCEKCVFRPFKQFQPEPQCDECAYREEARQTIAKYQRKKGKWIKADETPYIRKHYHTVCCSECHRQGSERWNYCPNCGADMRGGQDDN